jgi:hypothetical protein
LLALMQRQADCCAGNNALEIGRDSVEPIAKRPNTTTYELRSVPIRSRPK